MAVVLWVLCPTTALCCEVDTTSDDLSHAMGRFFAAWENLDEDGVAEARALADDTLGCTAHPLLPTEISLYFQVRGLSDWLGGDTNQALQSFHAAVEIAPDASLPEDAATPDDDWAQLYDQARQRPTSETASLPYPESGWLQVDGARTERYPLYRPWLFQRFNDMGRVVETRVVTSVDVLPQYEVGLSPKHARNQKRRRIIGWSSVGVGAVLMLGGGVAGGLASKANQDLAESCEDNVCLPSVGGRVAGYNRLRTLSTVGFVVGAGVVAGGVFAVALSGDGMALRVGGHL